MGVRTSALVALEEFSQSIPSTLIVRNDPLDNTNFDIATV